MRRFTALIVFTTLALAAVPAASAHAQSWGDRLKKKAEEAAKKRVEDRTQKRAAEAADKALDKVECAATDKPCVDKAQADGKTVVTSEGAIAGAAGSASGSLAPGEDAWVNYDFVPGARTIFFEDFSKDNVGDFPKRLDFVKGNFEVAEWQGGHYLRATTSGTFTILLPEVLPQRFTMEVDFTPSNHGALTVLFSGQSGDFTEVYAYSTVAGLRGGRVESVTRTLAGDKVEGRFVRLRVMADGRYVKVYFNSMRVANVPNASLGRSSTIELNVLGAPDAPMFVGNIRIAASGKKLYEALAEKGRASTQGIYFDTGSDQIRGESTPTLKEISAMLTEHPDLKLTIEGHTDSVGEAAANQDLSNRRAASVKAYLGEKYRIDGARLTSVGFGETKPSDKNDTPEGRQNNRRVELVKM
jgi:OmpA-OmpF porin, OOP family